MARRAEQQKQTVIESASDLAAGRLDTARADAVRRFVAQFYARVAPADLADRTAEQLYSAAASLWEFARRRPAGVPIVRVFNPQAAGEGQRRRTIIEIVNDDMPFLVDSVSMALNAEGGTIDLIIHPILQLERDAAGSVMRLLERGESGGQAESVIHVEIGLLHEPERLKRIAARLDVVLRETRAAVEDWRKMREALAASRRELEAGKPPVAGAELAEALDFLAWLDDDNFTYLGCRDYHFAPTAEIGIAPGLGILRDTAYRVFDGLRDFAALPPDLQAFLRTPRLLLVSKSSGRAVIHRPVHMDAIGVKVLGEHGEAVGMRLFLGLFTSQAYRRSARSIPLLRGKVAAVLARSGLEPASHDGKALAHILETLPRDELFQAADSDLFDLATGILRLQERHRVALFARRDPFGRFVSCFVFVPRDRYDTALRESFAAILESGFAARIESFNTLLDDAALAQVHFVLRAVGMLRDVDLEALEARLVEAARRWAEKLAEALVAERGEDAGLALAARYGGAFPAGYRERYAASAAVADIASVEAVRQGAPLVLSLYRPADAAPGELRLRAFRAATPCPLADVLPVLENMGLKAITEVPFEIAVAGDARATWIQDFGLVSALGDFDIAKEHGRFEEAFAQVWAGAMENDGLNRLVLAAGLDWRQVTVLRLYAKALRQAGSTFSQAYMEDALARHSGIAAQLVALFEARFDPRRAAHAAEETKSRVAAIGRALDDVESLDEDRILRGFLRLIECSLRTNYFQHGAGGAPKPYLSVKLASRDIELLPRPRPLCEIFVCSPRMEGVHLRGGKIARGGIRWSDRKEDFRTEILGLMKAQIVKNAVIVPTGSKGGFIVKRMPVERDQQQAEAIECYKTLMRGMLDLTDNIVGGAVVSPPDMVRHDGDDPYLVVAADKGTATFSDIANAVAAEYGFWLGDAYASGGSAGYDHKAMGITARGAWELIKRHFRELGRDIQRADFTCVGVGDMSGDVFGNGMLQSPRTKLIAAFNHRHVFIDPEPQAAAAFAERQRLFKLPHSSWSDYDKSLISAGGGVFERSAKSIALSPEGRRALDIAAEHLTPAELIQAILTAPVDLLFFGGIGTFVKASSESQAEVGDKSNDALRVDAAALRAKVVGEGANLGVTQRARIEYAARGGRIDTDAIDNSAGVDTSDHEVNLKILLNSVVAAGRLSLGERDALLHDLTDDIARLVLRDNYLQGLALSIAEAQGHERLDAEARLIRDLEQAGRLDRAIEFLPSEDALAARAQARQALTRPELSVLLAYVKHSLTDDLIASDFPDDPQLEEDLFDYFPPKLVERFRSAIEAHRLRRELIATVAANDLVNRTGITFMREIGARSGRGPSDVARAYMIVRKIFDLDTLWGEIDALDNTVAAKTQIELFCAALRLVERATSWFLTGAKFDILAQTAAFRPGIIRLAEHLGEILPETHEAELQRRAAVFTEEAVPQELAQRVARLDFLLSAVDIVRLASAAGQDPVEAGKRFFAIGSRFRLDALRVAARKLAAETEWQKLATAALIEDLYAHQAALTGRALAGAQDFESWIRGHAADLARLESLVREIEAAVQPDLAMLTVATRALREFPME
ncbi:MAG TPA: NAD-glutamate dehydrogenase domain-containing protein [Stellaceae bacterium]|nr:NAD-glutamate dehydrogenase domain-containing protein [Stellaceae bacterium]